MYCVIQANNVGLIYEDTSADDPGKVEYSGIYIEDLCVPAGGITAIIGESGSGKSTFLSLVSALKAANAVSSASRLQLCMPDDRVVDLLAAPGLRSGDVGYVFQDAHLMKSLPAGLNHLLGHVIAGRMPDDRPFSEIARLFGLTRNPEDEAALRQVARKRVQLMSGGQAQRVSVGRALALDPSLMVCDEPTSSLDPATGQVVMGELRRWAQQPGKTILWVTHNLEQAAQFADRYIVAASGRVFTEDGRPKALMPVDDEENCKKNLDLMRFDLDQHRHWPVLSAEDIEALAVVEVAEPARGRSNPSLEPKGGKAQATSGRRDPLAHGPDWGPLRLYGYLASCVWANLLAARATDAEASRAGLSQWVRWPAAPFRAVARFNHLSLMTALLLGLLVFYFAWLSLQTVDLYFADRLARPEASHFVLSERGRADEDNPGRLTPKALRGLQKSLSQSFGSSGQVRPPKLHGRYTNLFAKVSRSDGRGCETMGEDPTLAAMLAFDKKEPLYRELAQSMAGKSADAATPSAPDVKNKAIVTPQFLVQTLKYDEEARPTGFCLDQFVPQYIEIAAVVEKLPGTGTFQFAFGITLDTYYALFAMNPPTSGSAYPSYRDAALYFHSSYAEALSRDFVNCEVEGGQSAGLKYEGFKLNCDVLAQVASLIRTANASWGIIVVVMAALVAATMVSTILSLRSFVSANEKFLCIMRAFCYRFRHLFYLLSTQNLVVLLLAGAVFAVVIVAFEVFAVPRLAEAFEIPADWISLSWDLLSRAVLALLILTELVTLAILWGWWSDSRSLGDKLQEM